MNAGLGAAIQPGSHSQAFAKYPQLNSPVPDQSQERAPDHAIPQFAFFKPNRCCDHLEARWFESENRLRDISSLRSVDSHPLARKTHAKSVKEHVASGQSAVSRLEKLADKLQSKRRDELESAWLAAHRHEYRGQWIALDGDTLLAVAATSKEVFAQVANSKPTPLVIKIFEQDLPFAGW